MINGFVLPGLRMSMTTMGENVEFDLDYSKIIQWHPSTGINNNIAPEGNNFLVNKDLNAVSNFQTDLGRIVHASVIVCFAVCCWVYLIITIVSIKVVYAYNQVPSLRFSVDNCLAFPLSLVQIDAFVIDIDLYVPQCPPFL